MGELTARLGGSGLLSSDAQGQQRLSVRCSLSVVLQGQSCHLQGFVAEGPSVPVLLWEHLQNCLCQRDKHPGRARILPWDTQGCFPPAAPRVWGTGRAAAPWWLCCTAGVGGGGSAVAFVVSPAPGYF